MTISRRDYTLLKGLKDSGHAFISASEAEDALRLADEGYAKIWQISTGFSAWKLTEDGKRRIEEAIGPLEEALGKALETVADIAEGSTTANSLPNIAKIARDALNT